jgi:pyruvate kinase
MEGFGVSSGLDSLSKEMIQTRAEVDDYILPAVHDEDAVVDVKELIAKPH